MKSVLKIQQQQNLKKKRVWDGTFVCRLKVFYQISKISRLSAVCYIRYNVKRGIQFRFKYYFGSDFSSVIFIFISTKTLKHHYILKSWIDQIEYETVNVKNLRKKYNTKLKNFLVSFLLQLLLKRRQKKFYTKNTFQHNECCLFFFCWDSIWCNKAMSFSGIFWH